MPQSDHILIRGARQHNLKNVTVEIPRDKLVVITGLFGIWEVVARFRHDLRRGPEALRGRPLRLHARQFLELMEKPDVDLIEGGPLTGDRDSSSACISHNRARSPVGHGDGDLRLPAPPVRARKESRIAPIAARRSRPQSAQRRSSIEILKNPAGFTKLQILAPLIRGRIAGV